MKTIKQITDETCDRHHVGLPTEAVSLGILAAQCELMAEAAETPDWERAILRGQAEAYRQEQFKLLVNDLGPFGPSAVDTHREAIETVRKYRENPPIPGNALTALGRVLVVYVCITTALVLAWYIGKGLGWF